MDRTYKELLLSYDNIAWAWKKASSLYRRADGPIDAAELAAFELNLEAELTSIIRDFRSGTYRLAPLKLLPQPKKADDDGNPRMRESFHISVRDQVACIALVNVIGPALDTLMPKWSYGHRLYKAAWYEEVEGARHLNTGPYRHTTGNLYRKWQHSWPLFRRHVSLTSRLMVGGDDAINEVSKDLDESELAALNSDERPDYFIRAWPKLDGKTLYFSSIDLAKFYPTIHRRAIKASLRKYLAYYEGDKWLRELIDSLLAFEVDVKGLKLLEAVQVEPKTKAGAYDGVPTGLMVAGFLSNVALLPLDIEVQNQSQRGNSIAHFRFVDDHAILASDFDALVTWIRWYRERLRDLRIGPVISRKKYDPVVLRPVIEGRYSDNQYALAKKQCAIDGSNPTKLLTKTLALVSTLANIEFDTISIHSKQQRIDELVWLLMADLPDTEIRSDTRVAFAASRLTSLVPRLLLTSDEVLHWYRQVADAPVILKKDGKAIRQRKTEFALDAKQHLSKALETDRAEKGKLEAKYFRLICRTFFDHTDKPRLFLRLMQYCRQTGYNGLPEIFEWLNEHSAGARAALTSYLRLVAVQLLSKQVLECARQANDESLLHRERTAASRHLRNLGDLDVLPKQPAALAFLPLWSATVKGYGVALRGAAQVLRSGGGRWTALPKQFDNVAKRLGAPMLDASTVEWRKATGWTVGVWAHLLEGGNRDHQSDPSSIWKITAPQHNPLHPADWSNLRKFPRHLPKVARQYIHQLGARLSESDGGWLWDYVGDDQKVSWVSRRGSEPYISTAKHLREVREAHSMVTLEDWMRTTASLDGSDPRASEWTALELLRQIVDSTSSVGATIDVLERLHPSNIFVPKTWITAKAPLNSKRWTWEAWRREVSQGGSSIEFSSYPIVDYRLTQNGEEALSAWERQLRGCGLLLLSLLRKDWSFPPDWNVRGNQRDISGFVRHILEDVIVSTKTLEILESALLPRSVETRIIVQFPTLFFGIGDNNEIRGTNTDPPIIRNADELLDGITKSQSSLSALQISVLDHAPRQLVPMDVIQLTRSAVPIDEAN